MLQELIKNIYTLDIDECLIDGSCDQICHNTNGSFNCDCVDGYKKLNNTICKAINGINIKALCFIPICEKWKTDFSMIDQF